MDKNEEGTLKLAEAMNKLADAMTSLQDPVRWQKIFQDGARTLDLVAQPQGPFFGTTLRGPLPLPGESEQTIGRALSEIRATINLSDEEREKFVDQVFEKIKPQITEFNTFVKKSLKDMPAHRLKLLAKRIEEGHPPKLEQRKGCIFVTLEDREESGGLDEFYLGL